MNMLLNRFGQVILRDRSTDLNDNKYKSSPLLVCHPKCLDFVQIPRGWCGATFSSQEIFNNLQGHYVVQNQIVLEANISYEITLSDNSKMEIIMIPWESTNENNVMFLLKDDCATTLITDVTPKSHLEPFITNQKLRDSLKQGIDVLYINDGIYSEMPSTSNTLYPNELMLRSMVTLIQPRFVYGVYGTELPNYIQLACKQIDFYG